MELETENPVVQQPEAETQQPVTSFQLPDNLSGIDTESALERFQGNEKLFRKLLTEFSTEYKNVDDNIRNALKNGDTRLARELTHTIKGVSGNLSARALHMAATELESGIKYGKDRELNGLLENLEICF